MESVSVSSCRCSIFVSCVHHAAVINTTFHMTFSLLMIVEDGRGMLQSRSHGFLRGRLSPFAFPIMCSECFFINYLYIIYSACTEML